VYSSTRDHGPGWERISRILMLLFALVVVACPKPPELRQPCELASDCPGLEACLNGFCRSECEDDASCQEQGIGVYCVYGGCTTIPYDGPFYVPDGEPLVVDEGTTVSLDASNMDYVGSGLINVQWVQVAGIIVILSDENSLQPSFQAPQVFSDEELVFRLVVSDGNDTATAEHRVTLLDSINEAPVAAVRVLPGVSVVEGQYITLDGRASSDPNPGDTLTFTWTQLLGPEVQLGDLRGPVPFSLVGFVAPDVEETVELVWSVKVSDGRGGKDLMEVSVLVRDLSTQPCQNVLDCTTDAPCVNVSCIDGLCLDQVIGWCCDGAVSCDDGDSCTLDTCHPGFGCMHLPLPGCCVEDSDCGGGGECWESLCSEGSCQLAWEPGCCVEDSDCPSTESCGIPFCSEGQCTEVIQPNCCASDSDCGDADPCTVDSCDPQNGGCVHTPDPDCCTNDVMCADPSACTIDSCSAESGECVHLSLAGCCTSGSDCDDGNPCTVDSCDAETGLCEFVESELCCRSELDCSPPHPCVEGVCVDNGCVWLDLDNCCSEGDQDCSDGNPCTEDLCSLETGRCFHHERLMCCGENPDCDDQEPCTLDVCNSSSGVCSHIPRDGCCVDDLNCDDGNPCTSDRCDAGGCVHEPVEGCCSNNDACDDGNACTVDQCNPSSATCESLDIPGCCLDNADCSHLEDLCVTAQCQGSSRTCITKTHPDCCADTGVCEPAGACVIRICQDGFCASENLPHCCANALECDDNNPCTIDTCDSSGGICSHELVDGCCRVDGDCVSENPCDIATCEGGNCLFTADPTCCESDEDCTDVNPCTTDQCVSGQCSFEPIDQCCLGTNDTCIPSGVCDEPICVSLICEERLISACCDNDADCDDQNSCTDDFCDLRSLRCLNLPKTGCCTTAEDCNDNDPCTLDACDNGLCSYQANESECCPGLGGCNDNQSCTRDICLTNDGTCVFPEVGGCCEEDQDCALTESCVVHYCDASTQECAVTGVAPCCTDSDECDDGDSCTMDVCRDERCVHAVSCCTTDFDCDDGNLCTTDLCGPDSVCHYVPDVLGLRCEDGDSRSMGDFCSSDGACQGFRTSGLPSGLEAGRLRSIDGGAGIVIGATGSSAELVGLWVAPESGGGYPHVWHQILDVDFEDIDQGLAVSTDGRFWDFETAGAPVEKMHIDNDPVASVWSQVAQQLEGDGSLTSVLVSGDGDTVRFCSPDTLTEQLECQSYDVENIGRPDAIAAGDGDVDYWILGRDALDNSQIIGLTIEAGEASWDNGAPIGCGGIESCAAVLLNQLRTLQSPFQAFSLGPQGTVLQWNPLIGWGPVGPQASPQGMDLERFHFVDLDRGNGLTLFLGQENRCITVGPDNACLLSVDRWWLWPAEIDASSPVWMQPILLFEDTCGSAIGVECSLGGTGPRSIRFSVDDSVWRIIGSIHGPEGPRQLLLWRR